MNERAAANAQASRFGAWLDHHGFSIVASLGRMLRKPWATMLTVGVMAVALALPLGLWVVMQNLSRLGGEVQSSRDVAVFLKPEVDAAKAQAIADSLRARGDVAKVDLIAPEQALQQLRAREDLAAAIDALGEDAARAALPSVLRVSPRGDELLLAESLKALPDAERVQHDAVWRERLDAWLRFGGRAVLVLAALLGLGALLVVGNTVRLDIQSRREEIGVLNCSAPATDSCGGRSCISARGTGWARVRWRWACSRWPGSPCANPWPTSPRVTAAISPCRACRRCRPSPCSRLRACSAGWAPAW